ncbi:hypothetical protein GAB57_08475 [Campylobacter coli]|nr:hypothetical protein [Campylobacter coli]
MNTNKITDLHIQISKEDLKILDLLLKANEYSKTAEAEQSKRAASRVKPTEPDRAGKQSAQRSVGDVERELRGIDEAVKSRTIQPNEKFIFKCPNCSRKNRKVFYAF